MILYMQKLLVAFLLVNCSITFSVSQAIAQDAYNADIERVKLPADAFLITDFFDKSTYGSFAGSSSSAEASNDLRKNLRQRIKTIYKMQESSVRALNADRPADAEMQITEALEAAWQLLEEYPEVEGNEGFKELYRTVKAEYRSVHGMEEVKNREKGAIFDVKRELYEDKDDGLMEMYALPSDVITTKTEVPLIRNDQVNRHLAFYSEERPEIMDSWLKRSKKYFPMMRKIFREEGTPTELIHLSMIESGLNPFAQSWASAVGMWQFIEATGSAYGLDVDWWMDERRDPEKATRAAARHLRDLHDVWGDWHLAVANYNISPRGLKRAIRAGGGEEDYWSAYPHLPRETQGYIPGFIATTIIDRNAASFGFKTDYTVETYRYDVAEVDALMPLDKLAEAANISLQELKELNPELLRWATPPGSKYALKLPHGTESAFAANYRKIPEDERGRGVAMHTVSRGETLGKIARRYGSSVRVLYKSNEGLTSIIQPGQKIMVPMEAGTSEAMAANATDAEETTSSSSSTSTSNAAPASTEASGSTSSPTASEMENGLSAVDYTVKTGDTIGHIAEWFDVRASQIRSWNNTSNRITVGESLTMHVPDDKDNYYRQIESFSASKKQQIEYEQRRGTKVTALYLADAGPDGSAQYVVQKNDTLIGIAQSFGTSVSQIKRANNLNDSEIYEGQQLTIK
jgi:membrane-bound lytic murein transglycosylase D